MLYRHVFDKISTESRGILRVFVNSVAPARLWEISEAHTMNLSWGSHLCIGQIEASTSPPPRATPPGI